MPIECTFFTTKDAEKNKGLNFVFNPYSQKDPLVAQKYLVSLTLIPLFFCHAGDNGVDCAL